MALAPAPCRVRKSGKALNREKDMKGHLQRRRPHTTNICFCLCFSRLLVDLYVYCRLFFVNFFRIFFFGFVDFIIIFLFWSTFLSICLFFFFVTSSTFFLAFQCAPGGRERWGEGGKTEGGGAVGPSFVVVGFGTRRHPVHLCRDFFAVKRKMVRHCRQLPDTNSGIVGHWQFLGSAFQKMQVIFLEVIYLGNLP